VPAPESAHAIAGVVRKARALKEEGREATILFSLSGHGLFDLAAYEAHLDGTLEEVGCQDGAIAEALAQLPA
jgi:tryptophan synthase beta chain